MHALACQHARVDTEVHSLASTYTRAGFAHTRAPIEYHACSSRMLKTVLAFCEDPSDYSRVPMRQHASFFNLPADGTVARYYTMQFGNIREIEFTTLYGISLPLPCMQPHSMILRTVYVLVLVSPTTQLQLENCDY